MSIDLRRRQIKNDARHRQPTEEKKWNVEHRDF